MGQIDKILVAVAAVGRFNPPTIVNTVEDTDDAV
jgi:hypothetical protein